LPRQGLAGALLLGQLRPGGDPLLRPRRAASSRIAPGAGLGQPRGLFAGGVELRLLAGRTGPGAAVLRLRLSAAGLLRRRGAAGAAALGALAVGAVAVGRIGIGRVAVGRVRIGRLEVDELTVKRLNVLQD